MKKIIILFLLAFTAINITNAQDFEWAKRMGGTGNDYGYFTTVDGSGNVYTTGSFEGTVDFDPGSGVFNLTSEGGSPDIFISKLDASGNFVWARRIGDGGSDIAFAIAVDASGNVYTTGSFWGNPDFDPGAGTAILYAAGLQDVFILKLDANGNFVWAQTMGGFSNEIGYSIAVDASENVYITGRFSGTVYAGAFTLTYGGVGSEVFICKLDNSGNFVWAKQTIGASDDYGYSIALDASGNVITTGWFGGTVNFDPGASNFNLTSVGGLDIFISKLDNSGNFVWAKQIGGTSDDQGFSVAIDGSGNIYTAGRFDSTVDFDPGAGTHNLTSYGVEDIFVSKLDNSGNFVWAKQMGGVNNEAAYSIVLDVLGNVYTIGSFQATADFDPGTGTFNLTSTGNRDIFISKLDASGNFVWAQKMGGTSDDYGYSIALDASNNVISTGWFSGTADFDPGTGTFNLTSAGGTDMFIAKCTSISVVGIEENGQAMFGIHPNPANNQITVELYQQGEFTLQITDLTGKVVANFGKVNQNNQKYDISHLNSGVYFIIVSGKETLHTKRFVVQK